MAKDTRQTRPESLRTRTTAGAPGKGPARGADRRTTDEPGRRRADRAVEAPAIAYRMHLHDAAAHLFEVEMTIADPVAEGQRLTLPAWIPGSYLIRDFARQVTRIEARAGSRRLAIDKLDSSTWQVAPARGLITLRYQVYGWDLSVRGAHFDATHAFFNGTSVFLRAEERADRRCEVELCEPRDAGLHGWKVATTLPRAGARPWGFGRYRAGDYDELIDHPVEMGTFTTGTFEACGVPHQIVVTGRTDVDLERLCNDLKPVCEAQIRLFEPRSARAPFDRYLFFVTAVGEGYGGLEHRSSTALICNRTDLPFPGQTGVPDGYRTFLGLASHEYFHSWNVKRIKPAVFAPYELDREVHTRLLWIFEGFTSYYDDLMLIRAGAIDSAGYLQALSGTISQVLRGPGRHYQSVAESSFDAWSKYYRQDEHSPNAIVSYYTKGSLVAMCIDLTLRLRSRGRRSLDDVMRALWRTYGRDFDARQLGIGEADFAPLLLAATGIDLSDEITCWAYGTDDLPVAELLAAFGVTLALTPDEPKPWIGARTVVRSGELALATVYPEGPAHRAGLSAGDVLVALAGLKAGDAALKSLLNRSKVGRRVTVHAFRRDELLTCEMTLAAAPATEAKLAFAPKVSSVALALRRGWLGRSGSKG